MDEAGRGGIASLNFDIDSYALIMFSEGDDNLKFDNNNSNERLIFNLAITFNYKIKFLEILLRL